MSTDHPTGTSSSTLGNLQEQAGEKVSQLTEGVKDGVMRSEKSFRGNLSKQADDFANALRSAKSEVDPDSSVATMFDYAAENVGSIAQSLKSTDVTEMMESVRSFARTRPGAFLGIAALAGFATTRFLLASESGRGGYGSQSGSMSGSSGNYGSRSYSGSSYSGGGSSYGARSTGTDAMRSGSTGMGASTGATGSSYGVGSNSPSGSGAAGSTPPGYGSSGTGTGSSGAGRSDSGTPSSTVTTPASGGTGSSGMGRDTLTSSQGTRKPGQGGSNV
ncbi:hypothetical protein [Paracoccus sp. T5]|uniref:hypothetical protein n=1 Tax=Paracoccus sp. T5 TaxID=3402161 RepID=UPI003AE13606